jgi:excisionase family DNA binding protein
MSSELLTTREVAALLGVGPTSVKRWADTGLLQCVKTPGGHRRFPRQAVDDMVRGGAIDSLREQPWLHNWLHLLTEGIEGDEVSDALTAERQRVATWAEVGDRMTPVLDELGRSWEVGEITVLQEHLASERLLRGIKRIASALPVPNHARQALLATAGGDEHTIGLALVELALRELGWRSRWSGVRTPVGDLCQFVRDGACDLVCLSASMHSTDAVRLTAEADLVGRVCRDRGIDLYLGGRGLWPVAPRFAIRVHSFADFRARLSRVAGYTS